MILASDVFESGAVVDRLLFGTLLGLGPADLAVSGAVAAVAIAAAILLGRTWSAVGFDPDGARSLGLPADRADLLLLALVGVAAVAAIPAVGALLVTADLRASGRGRADAHGQHQGPHRAARSRSRSPRARSGCTWPTGSTSRPGPPIAVLGALCACAPEPFRAAAVAA